jgi:hypothetical protein
LCGCHSRASSAHEATSQRLIELHERGKRRQHALLPSSDPRGAPPRIAATSPRCPSRHLHLRRASLAGENSWRSARSGLSQCQVRPIGLFDCQHAGDFWAVCTHLSPCHERSWRCSVNCRTASGHRATDRWAAIREATIADRTWH